MVATQTETDRPPWPVRLNSPAQANGTAIKGSCTGRPSNTWSVSFPTHAPPLSNSIRLSPATTEKGETVGSWHWPAAMKHADWKHFAGAELLTGWPVTFFFFFGSPLEDGTQTGWDGGRGRGTNCWGPSSTRLVQGFFWNVLSWEQAKDTCHCGGGWLPLAEHSRSLRLSVGWGVAMPGEGGGDGGKYIVSSNSFPVEVSPPPFVCFVCSSLFSGRASLRHRRRSCASRLCFSFAFDWPGLFVVCQSSLSTTHTCRLLIRFHPRRRFPARRRRQTHQTSSYIPSYLVRRSSWLPGERRGGFSNPILQTITTTNPPSYDNPRHEPS